MKNVMQKVRFIIGGNVFVYELWRGLARTKTSTKPSRKIREDFPK